jgi:hypothetical protein
VNAADALVILGPDIDRVGARFVRAFPGIAREIQKTSVWIDGDADEGGRHLADTSPAGRIRLAPRLATFARPFRLGVVAHEFGHRADLEQTGWTGTDRAIELRADRLAGIAMGEPLWYAPPLWIQRFGETRGCVRLRPRFLDERESE